MSSLQVNLKQIGPVKQPADNKNNVPYSSEEKIDRLKGLLWDSEERFQGFLSQMPYAVRLYELDDESDLVFIGANQEADRLFRVDHHLFIGSKVEESFPNFSNSLIPDRHIRALQEGKPWQSLAILYRNGERLGYFDINAFLMTPQTLAVMLVNIPEPLDLPIPGMPGDGEQEGEIQREILELHINQGDIQQVFEEENSDDDGEPHSFPEIIPSADHDTFKFTDLFSEEDLQAIQDTYAVATNMASIICDPQGRPITKPSNFCRLCQDIIRKNDKGLFNCMASDAHIGRPNYDGPIMSPCLSGGLWDGGASICIGDEHIASWLVGQVRTEDLQVGRMLAYAREIGVDEEEFYLALQEVPLMSKVQFREVCNALFWFSNQISQLALQNIMQNRAIAARQRAEAALRRSQARLHRLSGNLILAQEEERKQLAIELHDGIGQSLTAAKYCVDSISQVLAQGGSPSEALRSASNVLKNSIMDVRRMQAELRPQMLDELGILETLNWFCREYRKIYHDISVEWVCEVSEADIPAMLKPVIYRICQEAMNNSAKHSSADKVSTTLIKDANWLSLVIEDNGQGFDPEKVLADNHWRRGLGLESMRKRAEVMGGRFVIQSKQGQGTKVMARWVI